MVNMEVKGENYSEEGKKLILPHLFHINNSLFPWQPLFTNSNTIKLQFFLLYTITYSIKMLKSAHIFKVNDFLFFPSQL